MQTKTNDNEGVAKALAGDALLAFRRLADGGMVIVAANGMKLHFSAEKVREAEAKLRPDGDGKAVPTPSPLSPPPALRGRGKSKVRRHP
jgi:hypothetical protein